MPLHRLYNKYVQRGEKWGQNLAFSHHAKPVTQLGKRLIQAAKGILDNLSTPREHLFAYTLSWLVCLGSPLNQESPSVMGRRALVEEIPQKVT